MKENTIVLLKGDAKLNSQEYAKFKCGDTIRGNDSFPQEIKRWSIEEKKKAEEELNKYRCSYEHVNQLWHIEEYALEYSEYNEDGDFIDGSDYEFALDCYGER